MRVGQIVEDFEAVDQSGATVRLSELLSTGPLVMYFYIKAMTPG
jgi:thioredoxin-dependent peroxiredoxin